MTGHLRLEHAPAAPRLRPRAPEPPPLALAVLAATAYVEVRAGRRSVEQLTDWVDRRTARVLAAMVRRRRRQPSGPCAITLRRVVVDGSRPDRPDIVVVLDVGERVVPVCVQVRRHDARWTVSRLATPDDHHPSPVADIAVRPPWEQPVSVEPW